MSTTIVVIICLVVVVGSSLALLTNKTRFFSSILGYLLIALHLLVLFRDSNMGKQVKFFSNISTPSAFFWELFGFLGYNFVLILGIILVFVAKKERIRTNNETMGADGDDDKDEEDENKE
jgi:predicted membrane protein